MNPRTTTIVEVISPGLEKRATTSDEWNKACNDTLVRFNKTVQNRLWDLRRFNPRVVSMTRTQNGAESDNMRPQDLWVAMIEYDIDSETLCRSCQYELALEGDYQCARCRGIAAD